MSFNSGPLGKPLFLRPHRFFMFFSSFLYLISNSITSYLSKEGYGSLAVLKPQTQRKVLYNLMLCKFNICTSFKWWVFIELYHLFRLLKIGITTKSTCTIYTIHYSILKKKSVQIFVGFATWSSISYSTVLPQVFMTSRNPYPPTPLVLKTCVQAGEPGNHLVL